MQSNNGVHTINTFDNTCNYKFESFIADAVHISFYSLHATGVLRMYRTTRYTYMLHILRTHFLHCELNFGGTENKRSLPTRSRLAAKRFKVHKCLYSIERTLRPFYKYIYKNFDLIKS